MWFEGEEQYVYMAPEEYMASMFSTAGLEVKIDRLTHILPALVGLLVRKGVISNTEEFNELLPYSHYGIELVDSEDIKYKPEE